MELSDMSVAPFEQLAERHPFRSVITMSFQFPKAWWGRISLRARIGRPCRRRIALSSGANPSRRSCRIQRIFVAASAFACRSRRACAFCTELHDGAVQSLIAMEMQVDVLKRQAVNDSSIVPDELSRIQKLMREEVLKLRELMQQMKSLGCRFPPDCRVPCGYRRAVSARNRNIRALCVPGG